MQILSTLSVTVGTSAVQVSSDTGLQANAVSVLIQANPANTDKIYVGLSGVTTGTGLILTAGAYFSLDGVNLATLYAISGTASQNIRVLVLGG